MTDFEAHLTRQAAFSRATFGPMPRTGGVSDHIRKELEEVAKVYAEIKAIPGGEPDTAVHMDAAREWTDVAILGLDGLLRAISVAHPDWTFDKVAAEAVWMIVAKQGKNELRVWPDWRTMSDDHAIEHERGTHD